MIFALIANGQGSRCNTILYRGNRQVFVLNGGMKEAQGEPGEEEEIKKQEKDWDRRQAAEVTLRSRVEVE